MWYLGSKSRISKELVPIIQSYIDKNTVGYLEPFVGGANVIDKIEHHNKIGYDIHPQLIALLKKARDDYESLPDILDEKDYIEVKNNREKYEDWEVGLYGFCATFGAKYFGGYARAKDEKYAGQRTESALKNLKAQALNLKNVTLANYNFLDIPTDNLKGYVIYCDIPYQNTTAYKTEKFPYEDFYEWVKKLSIHNTVLISEYTMPEEFECVWEKKTYTGIDTNRKQSENESKYVRVEKLFQYKG